MEKDEDMDIEYGVENSDKGEEPSGEGPHDVVSDDGKPDERTNM